MANPVLRRSPPSPRRRRTADRQPTSCCSGTGAIGGTNAARKFGAAGRGGRRLVIAMMYGLRADLIVLGSGCDPVRGFCLNLRQASVGFALVPRQMLRAMFFWYPLCS